MLISRLFILTGTLLFVQKVFPLNKSICGLSDSRIPSFDRKVGRLQKLNAKKGGCTITLIGRTCGISAGHCEGSFVESHFNVPRSDSNGHIRNSDPFDIYKVQKSSIVLNAEGRGNDWAVVRLKANEVSGQFPGDVQGFYYVNYMKPRINEFIRITGHGRDLDSGELDRNYFQQTADGRIRSYNGSILEHDVDTKKGSSGSAILLISNDHRLIGVHSHGGCSENGDFNAATLLSENERFKRAVRNCLKWERDNL